MKKVVIGLFGVSLSSVNYGVTALAYSQLKMLHQLEQECNWEFEYWIFSDETETSVKRACSIIGVDNIVPKQVIRIRTGLTGLVKMSKDIQKCNFVIDLTYGDSFSDIYGAKVFGLFSVPKFLTLINKKKLIIGPQTIGPFYKGYARKIATYLLQKAECVVARDEQSRNEAIAISGRDDVLLTSDLAMGLPYDKDKYEPTLPGKLNVGLNVSVLLWQKDASDSKFNVRLSYIECMRALIKELVERGFAVHLITHVYEENRAEYALSEKLHEEFPDTIVAPYFEDPTDAKSYISTLDVFIGARMHATIAAFSSGVPTIPISYSRKFEGLYGTVGYNHVVQCEGDSVEKLVHRIIEKIVCLESLKADVNNSYEQAQTFNKYYYDLLKRMICDKSE